MRVLLADDYRFIRRLVRTLLTSILGAVVVGEASSGEQAVALTRELRPDAVLMDISLEGMNGLLATWIIRRAFPETRILIVSLHEEADYVLEAFRAGACGYLPKSAITAELGLALAASERGEVWFSPSLPREDLDYCVKHLGDRNHVLARHQREIRARSLEQSY